MLMLRSHAARTDFDFVLDFLFDRFSSNLTGSALV